MIAASIAAAAAAAPHHTTLTYSASEFVSLGFAKPTETVSFSAALPWSNVPVLEARLAAASDPASPTYAAWMTGAEVNALTAPPAAARASAAALLAAAGAACEHLPHSLKCTAPVAAVEALFSTRVSAYAHAARGGARVLRVAPETPYAFPDAARGAVSFFTNLVDFPTTARKLGRIAAAGGALRGAAPAGDLSIMPEALDALYGSAVGSAKASQAPAEFQRDDGFHPTEVTTFATAAGRAPWKVVKNVGPHNASQPADFEASLDEQYMGAVGTGNANWYWTEADWQYEFVEAVAAASDADVSQVYSISWGWSEADQCMIDPVGPCAPGKAGSAAYVAMTNLGFAAAGVRGITMVVSSGDSGAHGRTDDGCAKPKTLPDWPTSSQYILAVGATAVKKGTSTPLAAPKSPFCKAPPAGFNNCAGGGTEIVASTATGALIVSGGGFSNVAPTPTWQAAQVKAFLAAGGLLPPSAADYNASGRAYPDVSALGHNYPIFAEGRWVAVDGTSCSSPVFGAVVALANAARLAAGKKTLGMIAPAIYAIAKSTPAAFNDITEGDNKCTEQGCAPGCTGFGAVKGFDVPTGVGTPNIPALIKALAAL